MITDPTELARIATHKQVDELYRTLWHAVYLREVSLSFPLSSLAADRLNDARAAILAALGLDATL